MNLIKNILFIIFLFIVLSTKCQNLSSSKWICKISDGCVDTIKFNKHNQADYYSCEMNYIFKGSYKVKKSIIVLTEKDDSHDEDGGKLTFFRLKFNLRGNILYLISNEELVNDKWQKSKLQINKNSFQFTIYSFQ